jgi:hypothetical protein
MKDIEKLKQEQQELKERLLKLTDFINSEEYYAIEVSERNLLNQQRAGMEIYLNALTRRICGECDTFGSSSLMLPFLMSMFSTSSFGTSPEKDKLQKEIDDIEAMDK